MPNPAASTRGRNCLAIRTPPDSGPDIFHHLLLTFDSSGGSGQRYIRPSFPSEVEEGLPDREVGPVGGAWDGIPNAFITICGPGSPIGRPRGRGRVRLHQPRQSLPVPSLPPRGRADRVLFPRDGDDLSVPSTRDRRT